MRNLFIIIILGFINHSMSSQDLKWLYTAGGSQADYGTAIAVDPRQNTYDLLVFQDSISISFNQKIYSKGAENVLIRKSTILGIRQWYYHLSTKKRVIANDIITDNNDDVYVTGIFLDSLSYRGNFILKGDANIPYAFLIKLDQNGQFIWARQFTTNNAVTAKNLSIGIQNEVIISGNFIDNADFGNGFTTSSPDNNDIFIIRLDSNGNTLFVKTIGGIDHDYVSQHISDKRGNIYLTGDFRSNLPLKINGVDTILIPKGLTDILLIKMNENGDIKLARSYGGSGVDAGASLALDNKRNIILTGKYSQTVSFGASTSTLQSNGGTDIYLVKIDSTGKTIWANSYGDTQNDAGLKVIVNKKDVIFLTGTFRGRVDFNPSPVFNNSSESKGNADVFYAVYNQDGTYNQHFSIGGIADEQIADLAILTNGDLVSCGGFGAVVDFDPSSQSLNIFSNGGLDAYLLSVFICVNPYLKTINVQKNIICPGETVLIQIVEGYLNAATQWSWQKNSCTNNTFASGDFINIPIDTSTSFFIKGTGGCIIDEQCIKVDIKIFNDSIVNQNIKLCDGETVTVGSHTYATSGIYRDTLLSTGGCDSIVITNVDVFHKYFITQNLEICNGDSVKVGKHVYKLPGTYTDPLQTINGCDSTIVTHLAILPANIENAEAIICKGDTVTIRGIHYTKGGIFIQSAPNPSGCTDMLIVKIIELETEFSSTISICDGESYSVGGHTYTQSGIYIDSLKSSYGCDSIINTVLNVHQHNEKYNSYTICPGESITINGKVYTDRNYLIDTLQNRFGCDSIVYTSIDTYIVHSPVVLDTILCEGQTLHIGVHVYIKSGFYIDTLYTINGCDSIIQTTLHILPIDHKVTHTICNGEQIHIGGQTFESSGSYEIPLVNQLGCDSIIHLTLHVIPIIQNVLTHNICPGESINVGEHTYSLPGTYADTLTAQSGCDSIVISILKFNQETRKLSYEICTGESVTINNIKYNKQGTYIDSLKTVRGCDSILMILITVHPKHKVDTLFEICKGESVKVGNSTYFNAGKYQQILTNQFGCDSVVNFEIKVVFFEPSITVLKDTLRTIAITDAKYQWFICRDNEQVPILGATGPTYIFSSSGNYAIAVTYNGCTYMSTCLFVIPTSTKDAIAVSKPIKLYPNPVYDILTVHTSEKGRLHVMSPTGIILNEVHLSEGESKVDISNLQSGMYIIEWLAKEVNIPHRNKIIKVSN